MMKREKTRDDYYDWVNEQFVIPDGEDNEAIREIRRSQVDELEERIPFREQFSRRAHRLIYFVEDEVIPRTMDGTPREYDVPDVDDVLNATKERLKYFDEVTDDMRKEQEKWKKWLRERGCN